MKSVVAILALGGLTLVAGCDRKSKVSTAQNEKRQEINEAELRAKLEKEIRAQLQEERKQEEQKLAEQRAAKQREDDARAVAKKKQDEPKPFDPVEMRKYLTRTDRPTSVNDSDITGEYYARILTVRFEGNLAAGRFADIGNAGGDVLISLPDNAAPNQVWTVCFKLVKFDDPRKEQLVSGYGRWHLQYLRTIKIESATKEEIKR